VTTQNKSRDRNVAAAHPDLSSRDFQDEVETRQIAPAILAGLSASIPMS
jgi:hypothetical protein